MWSRGHDHTSFLALTCIQILRRRNVNQHALSIEERRTHLTCTSSADVSGSQARSQDENQLPESFRPETILSYTYHASIHAQLIYPEKGHRRQSQLLVRCYERVPDRRFGDRLRLIVCQLWRLMRREISPGQRTHLRPGGPEPCRERLDLTRLGVISTLVPLDGQGELG